MTFQSNNNPIGSLDDGGRVASTGHGVPVFLLHVLATAQTDQIIGSQVRSGLAAGGSRIRTLGPPSAAGKDAPVWHRAPAAALELRLLPHRPSVKLPRSSSDRNLPSDIGAPDWS